LTNFQSHFVEDLGVNAKPLRTHQFLATQFQQDTLVLLISWAGHNALQNNELAANARLNRGLKKIGAVYQKSIRQVAQVEWL
jgi:hypothetical protein